MTKLTFQKKEELKRLLAENHISKEKLTVMEMVKILEIPYAVIEYYRMKWGYAVHNYKKRSYNSKRNINVNVSLEQAIDICKKNGLKVIQTLTKEL